MPRFRWKLTQAEQRAYRVLAGELNAAGVTLDLSEFYSKDCEKLQLRQCGESYARSCPNGSIYVVHVSVVSLVSKVVLTDFRFSSTAWDLGAYALEADGAGNELYRLWDGTTFHRNTVLNHRVGSQGTIRRGDQLEGLLLAQAFEPIPANYHPGDCIPIMLSLEDQFGDVTKWTVRLVVQPPYTLDHAQVVRQGVFERTGSTEPISPEGSAMPIPLVQQEEMIRTECFDDHWELIS